MKARGFTLLEVLIAISILGLALTVILSSQVGLYSSAARVHRISLMTNLVRCRMNETTLELMKLGFSLTDETDHGPCCHDESDETFQCVWRIERVELPGGRDLGELLASGSEGESGLGALGALTTIQQTKGASLGEEPSLTDLGGALGGGAMAGGVQSMAPLLMGMVYPKLKPMLEESIRKVTVEIRWNVGVSERTFELVQYVTRPQQGGFSASAGVVADAISSEFERTREASK